jgi:protocatechuate 3,4-dioxygenase, beta subunit
MLQSAKKLFSLVIIFVPFCVASASGTNLFIPNNLNNCKPLKISYNNYEPKTFNISNNLLKSTGGVNLFEGKEIVIKGKLVDKNCVPISDAKIYIWQVGLDGKYPYEPLKSKINRNLISEENDDHFQGSGIYTTNNLGEFTFITIYPGQIKNEKPHVNIKAIHSEYGSIQTKIYLEPTFQTKIEKQSEALMSHVVISALKNEKNTDNLSNEDGTSQRFVERLKNSPTKVELKAKRNLNGSLEMERGFLLVAPENNIYEFVLVTPFQNKFRRY